MTWRDYVPFAGQKTVRQRLAELEDEAGSLVIIFGTMFTKTFESIITGRYQLSIRFALAALATAIIYIYRREAVKTAKEVGDKMTGD